MEVETDQPPRVKKLNLFDNVEDDDYQPNLRNEWFDSNTPQKQKQKDQLGSDTRPSKRFLGNDFAMT